MFFSLDIFGFYVIYAFKVIFECHACVMLFNGHVTLVRAVYKILVDIQATSIVTHSKILSMVPA